MGTVNELLTITRKQLSVREDPPNSNNVRYNTWYYGREVSGSAYPWCAVFVQWCFAQASVKLPKRTASCGDLMRAAKAAGLTQVPVVIIEADDRKVMELGLIENLQREDLNPAEEARGFRTLMEEYGLTQEQVAQQMGKSRPAIANTLRLLALPDEVMALVEDGSLSAGHARAILGAPSPALQREAAKKVVADQLSVRQTETLIRALQKEAPKKEAPRDQGPDLSLYLGELEKDLSGRFGRKVKIAHRGKKGRIELEYYDSQDLEGLLALLQGLQGAGGEPDA